MKAFCIVFAFALLGIAVGDIVPAQEYDGLMVIEANVLSYASEFRFEPQSKTLCKILKENILIVRCINEIESSNLVISTFSRAIRS